MKISNQFIYTFLICCILLLISGCRKSSPHVRTRTSSRSESSYKESRARGGRGSRTSIKDREPEKEISTQSPNKKILSGSDIFKKYNNAVFMVYTTDGSNSYQGSGFFIGRHGLAVSNYHVFEGTHIGGESIKLSGNNTGYYKVSEVIYKDKDYDFIIFRVNYENGNYIPIANKKPEIGDKVYAIGSPRGLENTFSSGEVSQWRADYLMQINALIDHGSSGGALINEYGEVVGITSGSFCDGSPANLNYAWSIDAIKGHY